MGGVDASAYKNVWIFIEHEQEKFRASPSNCLGQGRRLADDRGMPALRHAPVRQRTGGKFAKEAIAYGAEKVYVMESPSAEDLSD